MLVFNFYSFLAPTAPPTNFVVMATGSSRTLSFSWDPPPLNHRNGLITNYNLTCYETVGGNVSLVTTPTFPLVLNESGSVQLSLRKFRPGTLFNCSVTSSNEAGTGPPAFTDITTVEEGTYTLVLVLYILLIEYYIHVVGKCTALVFFYMF